MHKSFPLLVGFAFVLQASNALSSSGQGNLASVREKETGTIKGRVLQLLDSDSPVRVESIELFVRDSPRASATAGVDADGKFVFYEVPAGRVRLSPKFAVGEFGRVSLHPTLMLTAYVRPDRTTAVTYFGKGRSVTGRIELPGGIDPSSVHVSLQLVEPPARTLRTSASGVPSPELQAYRAVQMEEKPRSHLDLDGSFRIDNVREGNYRINVSIEGSDQQLQFAGKVEDGYPRVESRKVTVDFMRRAETDDALDLGTLRYRSAR